MNLPNKLTALRILMIPLFMIITLFPFDWGTLAVAQSQIAVNQLIGAIIFAIASFTDWLDGYIARRDGLVTNFGKFADPLADKMLVATAMIVLVGQGLAPSWVVSIIISRELAVTGLRLLLVKEGEVMAAAWPGKIKTATQMVAIILLFLDNFPFQAIGIPVADIMLYLCLVFTIYSGVDYFIKNKHVFVGSM
ncbi:MAG: CDP-diacylglycerol--glycerol-3-phosphate 3-phosphatidyltransferase [Trichococcus flocculiformis]|uniref:CDP-diacylglycerol--glycerol-3-phosphate 3-phosphatidyltransferase n=1 Tax=Trichococcus flocculiformis TaxID=82803 RepID=A0A143Z1V3_9LACT|nr:MULTISPECIES: CDP-diacylglycerol--glycerol-3-phosphate 3-phosphatidyltransferase [Trichococcus]MBP6164405.1 CDP-diacylglycerol--glycerol-3-phosphate 3-phosphatidyltransferase [Trichococcus sp.]NCB64671.1 CDP-diacylglycerol--glycerol-3-phosphate 3-phosphatidyltransferase [Bacilli bacterium]MBP6246317.1 CDP-diacylglycerol--glycerol-3-phosphate 3-phosphatidyltransferase [Trichococcus sp.]MBP7128336.1 CDP-diacylglycerol--glycerol-3-phosphate 3-phosphatidyltransferase [Trichococcus sp.]MBP868228